MSESKKLGVCIVGCGDMGSTHAERWQNLDQAQIVAVVDQDEARAEKLAHRHGLDTWHTDYRIAVGLAQVDVVSVCVPTCDHPEVTIFAANQGKHALCEKPIALTLTDADRMQAAAEANGVKLGLGFMRRYSPMTDELKAWLGEEKLGRPVMYHATDIREIRPKLEMHDAQANGGPVIDMGVHLFDGWSYIFDSPPVKVFAHGLKLARGRQELARIAELAYDTALIVVHYKSGDIGNFVVSWGLPPGVVPASRPDQIMGPKGMISLGYGITHQEAQAHQTGGEPETFSTSNQDMYQLEITDFARAILEDQPPKTTAAEGKAALKVALAAIESMQSGEPVFLE